MFGHRYGGSREVNGIYRFVRARMHRRIFVGFALAILATGALIGTIARFSAGSPWQQQQSHLNAYLGEEFANDWNDPVARRARAERLSRNFAVGITLVDVKGEALEKAGTTRCDGPVRMRAPVANAAGPLGEVRICYSTPRLGGARFALAGALALLVLWLIAGKVARRITKPLAEVARVAEELARGNLSARARMPESHGEVREVAEALNRMAARIDKQISDQRALLATVSHEIRTPLARLRFLVERIRGNSDVRSIDDIEREVFEMDELVGELLAGSRLDFGAIARKPIDITALAIAVMERAEEPPEKLIVEGSNRFVLGDQTLMKRALANLLSNARRHGGGVLQLTITCGDRCVVFEVIDAGSGFAKGEQERAFEPFVSAGKEGSIGLGLALVRRIAEAHGGRAFAENREGGGARVVFEVPR